MKPERETNRKRLLITGNKLRVPGEEVGEGWGNWVINIKKGTWGRLGGTAVGRLPSAQGVIPALRDRAPHQALLL